MSLYPCLVLDHDDTVVKSTPEVHYPAFIKTLKALRPDIHISLDQFIYYCFDPGFAALCSDILKFSDAEMRVQLANWQSVAHVIIPAAYEGMGDIVRRQKAEGGWVCVVSHSEPAVILRDYDMRFGLAPDMVFGWDSDAEKRKPHPYPLRQIMNTLGVKPAELLMVDDLKPGLDMARGCGAAFAWAGWSCRVPAIEAFMRENADYALSTVQSLSDLLFGTH
jgi:HAD superfamily hydrolase (TIGR01509 family)